jgi:hypothetical protein
VLRRTDYGHVCVLIEDTDRDWRAIVDQGIAKDVLKLWRHGIRTEFSCEALPYHRNMRRKGKQIVLSRGVDFGCALRLLPWAGTAMTNFLGFTAVYQLDVPGDCNWERVWRA